jgi:hypothetical protein
MRNCLGEKVDVALTDKECTQLAEKKKIHEFSTPDYYVRKGNDIFLFELKDTLANASTKEKRNLDDFVLDLYGKFFKTEKNKPKAIMQLMAKVKDIQEGKFAFDTVNKNSNIYPVIIVDSTYFTMRGVCVILEHWMRYYCEKAGIESQNIKKLILMDISTLKLFASKFKQFGFKHYFEEYYNDISLPPEPSIEKLFNSIKSFSEYMSQNYKVDVNGPIKKITNRLNSKYGAKRVSF